MRYARLGVCMAAMSLLALPVHADKYCDAASKIKTLEKDMVGQAESNEKDGKDRETAGKDHEKKLEVKAEKKKAMDSAVEAEKEPQGKVDEFGGKIPKLTSDMNTADTEMKAAEKAAADAKPAPALSDGAPTSENTGAQAENYQALQAKAAEAKTKFEAAKKAKEDNDKSYNEWVPKLKTAQDKRKEATGQFKGAESDEVVAKNKKTASEGKKKTSNTNRTTKNNKFLNDYRDLSKLAEKCKDYQPSEIGISLTKTRFKTAQKILQRVQQQKADDQKFLFAGGKSFKPNPKTGKISDRSELLGGFGNGSNLPKSLADNLAKRIRESDEKYLKDQERAGKLWS